jgi:hypothetical protein
MSDDTAGHAARLSAFGMHLEPSERLMPVGKVLQRRKNMPGLILVKVIA